MDERQRQADGETTEAGGRLGVGRTQDDEQEHEREERLGEEHPTQGVVAVLDPEPVRRELAVLLVEPTGHGADDRPDQARRCDRTQHLRGDIGRQVLPVEPLRDREADAHRRIEVATGNVPECVRAGQDGEAERERHPDEPDGVEVAAGDDGEHGGAAPTEHEPQRSEELGSTPLHEWLIHVCSLRSASRAEIDSPSPRGRFDPTPPDRGVCAFRSG